MKAEEMLEVGGQLAAVIVTTRINKLTKYLDQRSEGVDDDVLLDLYHGYFVYGYIAAQLFDVPSRKLIKKIEAFKKQLIEEGTFRIVPRQKKSKAVKSSSKRPRRKAFRRKTGK